MTTRKPVPAGTPAPSSGQWKPAGGKGNEVTVPKGHRLPPTPKPGSPGWINVDPTKNKSGKGK